MDFWSGRVEEHDVLTRILTSTLDPQSAVSSVLLAMIKATDGNLNGGAQWALLLSFAYSALASLRMRRSGSAFLQRVKNSRY